MTTPRSEAGIYRDRKGVPIYPGDLLRTDHFRDRRRRMHYLYHVVVEGEDGYLEMVPARQLAGPKFCNGGRCRLKAIATDTSSEIIAGHGPGDCLDYADRPRTPRIPAAGGGEGER